MTLLLNVSIPSAMSTDQPSSPSATSSQLKSSILRDSGHGWSSPHTVPLRISKRSPSTPHHSGSTSHLPTAVARRSSNSYKHLKNNNLVSKSPFKSNIPAPVRVTRSQTRAIAQNPNPVAFPSSRKVSGEVTTPSQPIVF